MSLQGGSRTTFLAYQSPGALSGGSFRELEIEANGVGVKAAEAAHAATAVKANPAAKEITGAQGTLAGNLAAGGQTTSNLASNDDRARRGDAGFNISSPMGAMQLAQFAAQQGVGWAKDKPELMALGPQAIQALADAKLSQASFERLEKDAGFTARDVVDLAKFAKKKDIDSNKLSGDVATLLKGLPKEERAAARDDLTNYFRKPDDPATGKKLDETLENIRTRHPEKAGEVDQAQRTMKRQQGAEQKATATANSEQQRASTDQAQADGAKVAKQNSYDALNNPPQEAAARAAQAAPAP